MLCYRYVTPALKGSWYPSRQEALEAALAAGQAGMDGSQIMLLGFVRLETQEAELCRDECAASSSRLARQPQASHS